MRRQQQKGEKINHEIQEQKEKQQPRKICKVVSGQLLKKLHLSFYLAVEFRSGLQMGRKKMNYCVRLGNLFSIGSKIMLWEMC